MIYLEGPFQIGAITMVAAAILISATLPAHPKTWDFTRMKPLQNLVIDLPKADDAGSYALSVPPIIVVVISIVRARGSASISSHHLIP